MTDSNFYLGRAYDLSKQTVTTQQTDYDPTDLTTHAVVTGMTGSGKTGLCITLLEEAALKGIPAGVRRDTLHEKNIQLQTDPDFIEYLLTTLKAAL